MTSRKPSGTLVVGGLEPGSRDHSAPGGRHGHAAEARGRVRRAPAPSAAGGLLLLLSCTLLGAAFRRRPVN
ncbi:MAG: hypothetical protein ABIK09_06570 [Pseudomonadota bacterium]